MQASESGTTGSPGSPTAGIRKLVELGRPQVGRLALATVFLLMGSAVSLSYPLVIGKVVDLITAGEATELVDQAALGLVVLFAALGLMTALRVYLFDVAGERVVADLRGQLYSSLVRQEVAFFDSRRTGELINRLSADTSLIQDAVTTDASMVLRFGVALIGSLTIMTIASWRLTLVMLAVVPFVAVGATIYGRMLRAVSREVQDALAESTAVAEESLSGIRTVRAFAREDTEVERYGEAVETSFLLARRRSRLRGVFLGLTTFLGYSSIAGVTWYGGRLVGAGQMTIGELTSFVLYTFTLAVAIGMLTSLWADMSKALGASERVFELMGREPQVAGGELTLEEVRGDLRLEGVDFSYPSRPEAQVLSGFSLELRPGEVVALVGPSGAGKSTVAALLTRFYDLDGGRILLDERSYEDLDVDWLRRQVGVVAQEPILFATSIAENIAYGKQGASEEEIVAAAKAANVHEFVSALPEGYQTLVGERGVRLSGGQKQRVAIARALLKNPRLLILDEATSALDAESEHLVQEALDRLQEGRTTLVIAHRLSTVRGADRVVVLEQGRVVQEGPHEELVAQEGLYRRLVQRQFAEVGA